MNSLSRFLCPYDVDEVMTPELQELPIRFL